MSVPKRKRFNQKQRLQSARSWLQTYQGQRIVRDYRKHYGVDFPTAFKELELLGVSISPEYKEAVLRGVQGNIEARRRKKLAKQGDGYDEDQDANFAYIAGYTAGGAAYGLTWDEWNECCGEDSLNP
jgi:hypothetical protein